jgi:hypothetical protein
LHGLSLFGFGDPFTIVLALAPTWSGFVIGGKLVCSYLLSYFSTFVNFGLILPSSKTIFILSSHMILLKNYTMKKPDNL